MDFQLADEQRMIKETVYKWSVNELGPLQEKIDEEDWFPPDFFKKCAEIGILGITIDEKYGDLGGDVLMQTLAIEEMSRICPALAMTYGAHSNLCAHNRGKNMPVVEFTDTEFMICAAARLLEDRKTVFIGWGMPQVAAILAERLYTPHLVQLFEFGAVGPQSLTPFIRGTMGGPSNIYRSLQWINMNRAFSYAATGYIDYGMLGAAQVDQFGNLNSTFVGGTYERPERRLPGSGGGNEAASFCWKTIVVLKHEPRRFVEKVDFLTSPGYLDGPGARERAGLPKDTGPWRVVTSKALFDFDEETKKMRLMGILKGLDPEEVIQGMGFKPLMASILQELDPPKGGELHLLREHIDPSGIIIRGEKMRAAR